MSEDDAAGQRPAASDGTAGVEPELPRPISRRPIDRAMLAAYDDVGELVLVRHGQQDFSRRDVGVDHPLTELGRAQAQAVAEALADEPVRAVYSSGMARARDTGHAIAARHGLDVQVVDALEEIRMFAPAGDGPQTHEELEPFVLDGAQELFVQTRRWDSFPLSESGEQFRRRIVPAIEGILATHPGERIVVACHGGVINAYLASMLALTEDMFFRPAHTSIHRVAFHDLRRVIRSLGDVHHLTTATPTLFSQ